MLLKERGIALVEEKSTDPGDFGTMIQTEVETDRKTYVASGTLFGKQLVRLVGLGPYHLDAHLEGNLFVFTHRDVPGLIGFIGTTLGRHKVNIAQMNVGREHPGGERDRRGQPRPDPPGRGHRRGEGAPRHPERQPDPAPRGRRVPPLARVVSR